MIAQFGALNQTVRLQNQQMRSEAKPTAIVNVPTTSFGLNDFLLTEQLRKRETGIDKLTTVVKTLNPYNVICAL